MKRLFFAPSVTISGEKAKPLAIIAFG